MPTLSAKSKRKSSRSCGSLCLVTRHVHVTFYRRIVRVRIDLCLSITSIALCFLARHSPRPPAPDRPPAQHIHRRQHQHQARVRAAQRHHRPAPHVDLVHSPKQARGFLVLGQLAPPTRTTRPSPVSRGATRTTRLRGSRESPAESSSRKMHGLQSARGKSRRAINGSAHIAIMLTDWKAPYSA